MRKDMAKILVERPRVHDSYDNGKKYRREQSMDLEDLPQRESMKAHKGGTKQLNENLAPLYRFLQSRCGKRWDDVHSEISANLKLSSATQKHILDHLKGMVSLKTYLGVDGKVWVQNKDEYAVGESYRYREFYVDPQGILRMMPKKARTNYKDEEKAEAFKRRRDISKLVQYHKINGIWYHVQLVPYKLVTKKHTSINPVTKKTFTFYAQYADTPGGLLTHFPGGILGWCTDISDKYALRTLYGREGVFAISRNQLSSKDLKRAGLKNDPA